MSERRHIIEMDLVSNRGQFDGRDVENKRNWISRVNRYRSGRAFDK